MFKILIGRLKRTMLNDILSIWFKLFYDQSNTETPSRAQPLKNSFNSHHLKRRKKKITDIPIRPARHPIHPPWKKPGPLCAICAEHFLSVQLSKWDRPSNNLTQYMILEARNSWAKNAQRSTSQTCRSEDSLGHLLKIHVSGTLSDSMNQNLQEQDWERLCV